MATRSVTSGTTTVRTVGILRLAVTGALAAMIFFALCWAGAALGFTGATHMYLELFTFAEASSGLALFQGLCMSFLAGLIGGALFALVYNALGTLDRG